MPLIGKKVFLAAGVISTLMISNCSIPALRSRSTLIQFHPYFILPLMTFRKFSGLDKKPHHALAQLFVEVDDRRISQRLVHLQIYTHNRVMIDAVRARLRIFGPLRKIVESFLLGRLVFIQGYLHSEETPSIQTRALQSDGTQLELRGSLSPEVRGKIRKVAYKILRGFLGLAVDSTFSGHLLRHPG